MIGFKQIQIHKKLFGVFGKGVRQFKKGASSLESSKKDEKVKNVMIFNLQLFILIYRVGLGGLHLNFNHYCLLRKASQI